MRVQKLLSSCLRALKSLNVLNVDSVRNVLTVEQPQSDRRSVRAPFCMLESTNLLKGERQMHYMYRHIHCPYNHPQSSDRLP